MVSTELYVAGLKRKEMVEITHGSSVEGSRGTRYRLYGTYTDPETKKIHKANSFVSKAKYDEITAKMTAGMPVADMTIEKVEVFAEDSPVDTEPSDLGGPTEPDNAGVPADVGGDEPVPMGDEPSDIDAFEAEKKNCGCGKDPCVTYGADTNVGTTIDDVIMDEYVDEGEALDDAEDYARKARRALTEREAEADLTGIIVQDNDPSSPPEGIFATEQEREMEEAARKREYGYTHPTMDDYRPEFDDPNFVEDFDESAMDAWELEQERLREEATKEEIQDVEEPLPEIVEEEVVEKSRRPEPGTWAGIALDMVLSGDMTPDEANRWKDEMKERGFDAEMTLKEWGETELGESKHEFRQNPNESFREWLDEEVRAHGDISFREWADEEEHESHDQEEEKAAERVMKSEQTDQDLETVDTQVGVALGIPPEIWLTMSHDRQDAYIASMGLDVVDVRELTMEGVVGFKMLQAMANAQKEDVTSGDLSLIECNVCGISASQLLSDLGGVCEITDPNAGANPNYLRGVSCPFEKYYSLTRAVYDQVEDELRENRTVVEIYTPPPMVLAAETDSKLTRLAEAARTFQGQNLYIDKPTTFNAPYAGADALMDITKDTSLGDFTSKELTESSAIQGDFDHASLNYSGQQNIQARAEETFKSDSWDDLYVVAENQMGGWEACDVTDGVLQTYANQADAEREAQMTIEDLNEMYDWDSNPMGLEEGQFSYGENSWAGKRLSEVGVADNVEFIRYPNGLEAPYDEVHQGRSMNDPAIQLNATRGIDTFTEPFEDDDEKTNWLKALGLVGAAALAYMFIPKGE